MATPRRQQQALTNIQREVEATAQTPEGEQRRAALRALYEGPNAIFERDPTRADPNAQRLRQNVTALDFAARVSSAMGGDAQRAANIFAGSGVRNPQAFMSNQRDLMAFLGTSERRSAIHQMLSSTGYSDADVARRTEAIRGDELSQITRAEQEGVNALTRTLALEEGAHGITANVVAPGRVLEATMAFAIPKSVTTAVPPERRMFSGLMSR